MTLIAANAYKIGFGNLTGMHYMMPYYQNTTGFVAASHQEKSQFFKENCSTLADNNGNQVKTLSVMRYEGTKFNNKYEKVYIIRSNL